MDSLYIKIKNWFRTYQIVGFTLLCAIFLWFYVVTDNEFAHIQKVPLYIENKPADWILAEPIPEFVDVRFRGTGKGLIRLLYSDVHLELDLNHLTKPSKIRLNIDMIKKIPRGSNIVLRMDQKYPAFDPKSGPADRL